MEARIKPKGSENASLNEHWDCRSPTTLPNLIDHKHSTWGCGVLLSIHLPALGPQPAGNVLLGSSLPQMEIHVKNANGF